MSVSVSICLCIFAFVCTCLRLCGSVYVCVSVCLCVFVCFCAGGNLDNDICPLKPTPVRSRYPAEPLCVTVCMCLFVLVCLSISRPSNTSNFFPQNLRHQFWFPTDQGRYLEFHFQTAYSLFASPNTYITQESLIQFTCFIQRGFFSVVLRLDFAFADFRNSSFSFMLKV